VMKDVCFPEHALLKEGGGKESGAVGG
jgi:hypothetical protein